MFVNKRPADWTAGLFLAWLQSPCVPSMNALNQKDLNWGGVGGMGGGVGTVSMILLDVNKKKSGLSEEQMDTNEAPAQNRQPVRF